MGQTPKRSVATRQRRARKTPNLLANVPLPFGGFTAGAASANAAANNSKPTPIPRPQQACTQRRLPKNASKLLTPCPSRLVPNNQSTGFACGEPGMVISVVEFNEDLKEVKSKRDTKDLAAGQEIVFAKKPNSKLYDLYVATGRQKCLTVIDLRDIKYQQTKKRTRKIGEIFGISLAALTLIGLGCFGVRNM